MDIVVMRIIIRCFIVVFLFSPPGLDISYAQTGETVPHLTDKQRREYRRQERKNARDEGRSKRHVRKAKRKKNKAVVLKVRIERNISRQEKTQQSIVKAKQQQHGSERKIKRNKRKEGRFLARQRRLRKKRSELQLKYSMKIQNANVERRMRGNLSDSKKRDRKHCFERFKKRLKGKPKR